MRPTSFTSIAFSVIAFLAISAELQSANGQDGELVGKRKLSGIVHQGEKACPENGKGDCTLYFELDGEAAKAVFQAMRSKATVDECTGGMMKIDPSGLHCYAADNGNHGCYFGYDVVRAEMTSGLFSC